MLARSPLITLFYSPLLSLGSFSESRAFPSLLISTALHFSPSLASFVSSTLAHPFPLSWVSPHHTRFPPRPCSLSNYDPRFIKAASLARTFALVLHPLEPSPSVFQQLGITPLQIDRILHKRSLKLAIENVYPVLGVVLLERSVPDHLATRKAVAPVSPSIQSTGRHDDLMHNGVYSYLRSFSTRIVISYYKFMPPRPLLAPNGPQPRPFHCWSCSDGIQLRPV